MGQRESKMNVTKAESKIIAAIDFGTSYTGFAYAFSENMETIFTGEHGGFLKDDRVPTVLLLKPDDTFSSFGVVAEEQYATLLLNNGHEKYRLFREFKMALYSKNDKLHKELTINDTEGRSKNAVEVFSMIIKHLKELIVKSMKDGKSGETSTFENEIQWMLTLPAIWSDSARQFMREAAILGGIPGKKIRLVLEPEAAALFCKRQLLNATQDIKLTSLPPGTKYILADLGGGTADICAHEILKNEKVRELYRVNGGPFGGVSVNKEFTRFLIKLLGEHIWKQFEKENMLDHIQVMREFERNKINFDFEHTHNLIINIPASLVNMLERDCLFKLKDLTGNAESPESLAVNKNKVVCNREVMKTFFDPSVEGIVKTLREIVLNCDKDKIETLLMVGGYAESQYVRKFIEKEMNQMKVVLVQEPRLAVLKGAVLMGLESKDIIQRRARYTYGFSNATPFQKGIHQESLKFTWEGRVLCNDIFSKVIEKGQILTYNEKFKVTTSTSLKLPDSKKMRVWVKLYRTDKHDPEYCLETENCIQVGKIAIEPPEEGWPDCLDIDSVLVVGETEFTVQAIDKSNGKEYETFVDFL